MSDAPKANLTDLIRIYLPLFIAILGGAVTWGMFTTRLSANEERISAIETRQSKYDDTLTAVQIGIAKVQSDVSFIREKVK